MPLCPLVCVGSVSLHRLLTLPHVCQFLHLATGATTGTCKPCPTGTYKKTTGPGPCSDCPAGKTSPVGSSLMSSCKFCARDYFLASQNLYTMSSQDCFPSSTAGWQGAVESGMLSGSNPECFLTRALSLLSIDLLPHDNCTASIQEFPPPAPHAKLCHASDRFKKSAFPSPSTHELTSACTSRWLRAMSRRIHFSV